METNIIVCPHCQNDKRFHFNHDWGKPDAPVIDILCNECGKYFVLEEAE